ncbi:hypothetical protein I6B53_07590 [Schaalia sp. 19OD2882]|uniref:hypothetical protein n=1 Tax=Schaalia sp. 19OD2882 TaxID=2794089 RepID=UPI001C1E9A24|nr:hypothetical protein [Schaalia sp. 19OD2882]QWW18996.1 hypothetical protein I6B53_07590 [Schaalia sp. 19OD2882]
MPTPSLPSDLAALLPASDAAAPCEPCEEGLWAVAGAHAFFLVDGGGARSSGMWYEVQHVTWEATSRALTVTWTDPGLAPARAVTLSTDPRAFLVRVRESVERTQVVQRRLRTHNGTRVVAQVRRAPDGTLFSVLTADGPVDARAEEEALMLEREVRESVGLD